MPRSQLSQLTQIFALISHRLPVLRGPKGEPSSFGYLAKWNLIYFFVQIKYVISFFVESRFSTQYAREAALIEFLLFVARIAAHTRDHRKANELCYAREENAEAQNYRAICMRKEREKKRNCSARHHVRVKSKFCSSLYAGHELDARQQQKSGSRM